jgi:hypothetical protein
MKGTDREQARQTASEKGCCGKPVGCKIRTCWLGQHPWKRAVLDHDDAIRCQAVSYCADEHGVVRGGADTQMQCALANGHDGAHQPIHAPKITMKVRQEL